MSLFIPAWKSENSEKALKTVKKCYEEEKLVTIAMEAPLESVRLAAVKKLRLNQSLNKIVMGSSSRQV